MCADQDLVRAVLGLVPCLGLCLANGTTQVARGALGCALTPSLHCWCMQASMPELPAARRERYLSLGLPVQDVLQLADEPAVALMFDSVLVSGKHHTACCAAGKQGPATSNCQLCVMLCRQQGLRPRLQPTGSQGTSRPTARSVVSVLGPPPGEGYRLGIMNADDEHSFATMLARCTPHCLGLVRPHSCSPLPVTASTWSALRLCRRRRLAWTL